jgi:hypothetical protein
VAVGVGGGTDASGDIVGGLREGRVGLGRLGQAAVGVGRKFCRSREPSHLQSAQMTGAPSLSWPPAALGRLHHVYKHHAITDPNPDVNRSIRRPLFVEEIKHSLLVPQAMFHT